MNPRLCPGCPGRVPIVSDRLAARVCRRLPPETNPWEVIAHAVDWLTRPDDLQVVLGVTEREYWPIEKLAIASEVWRAALLPCPFAMPTGCALGGLASRREWQAEERANSWFFLPTALLRVLNRPLLRDRVARRLVADAKISRLLQRSFPIVVPRQEGPYPATPPITVPSEKEVPDGTLSPALPARSD